MDLDNQTEHLIDKYRASIKTLDRMMVNKSADKDIIEQIERSKTIICEITALSKKNSQNIVEQFLREKQKLIDELKGLS